MPNIYQTKHTFQTNALVYKTIMKNSIFNFFNTRPLILSLALLIFASSWSCAPMDNNTSQRHIPPAPVEMQSAKGEEHLSSGSIDLFLEENLSLESTLRDVNGDFPGEMTIPEPEETVSQEVEDLEKLGSWVEKVTPAPLEEEKGVEYDFPITMNRQVEYYLDFFQNRQRKSFSRWLSRSGRYLPMIHKQLQEAGLPLDLVYLPMIESGYSLTAYSKARAVGPWQFMRATGINFGLKVTNYVDERRDPIKSTAAAIAYLKFLFAEFNSWELAVAGYNAGEGRIRRGINKFNTNDFWELAEHRFLPSETKLYVPKLIAAILIAKDPEKYGFGDVQLEEPLNFEYAKVPRWTSLRAVAIALDADFDEIHNLNRELKKLITPPDQEQYELKIPAGSKELLASNLPRVHTTVTTLYKTHKIKKGDTLDKICKKYNLNKTTILKANDLRHSKMPVGKLLRIPYRETQYVLLSEEEMNNSGLAQRGINFILHKIQPGETVGKVASKYKVSSHLIAAWNGLDNIHKIRAGQQLALYISDEYQPQNLGSIEHETVTKKETRKKSLPLLTGTSKKVASAKNYSVPPTYYKVKGGDSLWKIARRFNIETKDIKRWNNLKNNMIHPGLKLVLKI